MEEYNIGEIAKLFDVSTDTLRLYDKMGIVCPERKANGYRCYSRNNMIALAYVIFLRKTELSLEQIRILLNNTDIENSQRVMGEQEILLQEKIERLQNLKNIVREYSESFKYGFEKHGEVKTVENVTIVLEHTENNTTSALLGFPSLNEKYKFNFTFLGKKEMFLRERIDNPEEVILNMSYTISTIINSDSHYVPSDFPPEFFKIIPPRKYVFSVIKCRIPHDYNEFSNILAYIYSNKLKIDGDILVRTLSLRNGPSKDIDYYEIYVPVQG